MNEFLAAIDSAFQRLTSVILLLITSAVVKVGSENIRGEIDYWSYVILAWAVALWGMSLVNAAAQIWRSPLTLWIKLPAAVSFGGVYIAVAAVSYLIGFEGIRKVFHVLWT